MRQSYLGFLWSFRKNLQSLLTGFGYFLILNLAILPSKYVLAQNQLDNQIEKVHPLKPADTTSPRATLQTFLTNITQGYLSYRMARQNYQKESGFFISEDVKQQSEVARQKTILALRTFDVSKIPPAVFRGVSLEAMLMLKEILDRIELPQMESIPDAQQAKLENIEKWILPNTEIVISKIKEGPRAGEFLFSSETVARIKEFYLKIRNLPYQVKETEGMYTNYISSAGRLLAPKWLAWVEEAPQWLKSLYFGQTVWQWIALVLSFILAAGIPMVARYLSRRLPNNLPSSNAWAKLFIPIIAILSFAYARYLITTQFNISGQILVASIAIINSAIILLIVWTIVMLARAIAASIIATPLIDPRGLNASVIRVSANIIGGLFGVAFFFWGASRLGIPIVPLLGGLGLGGLAVALAIGPTLENLIGGLTLYFDQSVRVGDFCRYGDRSGTVEKIGLRSTRVRAFDRTVTSIPNSEFSNMQITNISYRDKRLVRETIGLRYETSPEQLRYVMTKIREMLIAHPQTEETPLPSRVRLVGFGASSFDIEIFAYIATRKLNEFIAIREDIFLRVIDIVAEAGTGFAFPSMTTYMARDGGLDSQRSQAAEKQVQEWRDKGELPFPHFEPTQIEKLSDTLDFPPKGSSGAPKKA